jgi:Protein of unknown function (DUF3072)
MSDSNQQAEPGTVVEPAVDPDTSAAEPAAGSAETQARTASADDTIGADTPGRASTTEKDPSEWVTGDEPMTGAQRSYLDTLARQAGEQLPADLTKAEASEHIDRLQRQTGRRPTTG